jgi:hypothetical protein
MPISVLINSLIKDGPIKLEFNQKNYDSKNEHHLLLLKYDLLGRRYGPINSQNFSVHNCK